MWFLEQEPSLQQVQAKVQPTVSLGPYDLAHLMVLEVSLGDGVMLRAISKHR